MDKETDISQIYRYHNGDLDAKAMHQLEKRALDDPFLMDALEGYEANGKNQQAQLDEISQRLKKRISGDEKRIVPWHYFAIAASVLVVATIGGVLVFHQKSAKPQLAKAILPIQQAPAIAGKEPEVNNEVATAKTSPPAVRARVVESQPSPKSFTAISESTAFASPVIAADATVVEAKKSSDDVVGKDSMPLNEMIVTEYTSGKKKDLSQNVVSTNVFRIKKADTVATQLLPAQVKGVAYNNVTPRQQGYLTVPQPNAGYSTKEETDLHKDYEPSKSVASALGIQAVKARKTAAVNTDSAKNSSTNFTNNSLAEVVVAAPAPEAKRVNNLAAHPKKGWENFKKYLEDNAISPDKKTGKVTVSFQVDQNGVISNLQIISGLSDATNQKALYLISNGPGWVGNTNGLPENVKVKIQFTR